MFELLVIAEKPERAVFCPPPDFEVRFAASAAAAGSDLDTADCVLFFWEPGVDPRAQVEELRADQVENPIPILLVVGPELDPDAPLPAVDGLVDRRWPDPLVAGALNTAINLVQLGVNVARIQETVLQAARVEATGLYERAVRDDLTGLYNRRHYDEVMPREHQRALRHELPYAIAVIDLDDLKALNSRHGHSGGSAALREVAAQIDAVKRIADYAFRFGGDEFVVFLTESDKGGALKFGERLLARLRGRQVDIGGQAVDFTVTIGVAAYPQDGEKPEEVFDHADQALFRAKDKGKNRVESY